MIPLFFVAVPVPTRYEQKQNMAQNLLLLVTAGPCQFFLSENLGPQLCCCHVIKTIAE